MALKPDLAIISESATPEIVRSKAPGFHYRDARWVGNSQQKGLAVYAFNGLSFRDCALYNSDYEHFLPLEVVGDVQFNLLAVWAYNQRTKVEWIKRKPVTRCALEHYRPFIAAQAGIIAGDFNANVIWDKPGRADNFANMIQDIESIDRVSAYHVQHSQIFGKERDPTISWYRDLSKPYHIDYCFMPRLWIPALRRVTVGVPSEWLGESDHVPIVIEFDRTILNAVN